MEIQINNLCKAFDDKPALDNISLSISNGMFGLLGPNGAGKTTLLRILATILAPDTGRVSIGDYSIITEPHKVRSLIGYLPQDFGLYRQLDPVEFLDYVALLKGIKSRHKRNEEIENALDMVNLLSEKKKKIKNFSGGMLQRLGIAQALLGSPPVLILDEPTAGLDPEERTRFRNILTDLSRDRVIILSTHVLADIESSCSTMAILKKGRLVYTGRVDGIIEGIKDKVWEKSMDLDRYDMFDPSAHLIISNKRTREGFTVRFISDTGEQDAKKAGCSLEDGYIYLMGGYEYAKSHNDHQI